MAERRGSLSFDSACLDLARHFFPDWPEHMLCTLAQELQDVVESYPLEPETKPLNADEMGDGCPNDE